MAEAAGQFHATRVVGERVEALSCWLVTTTEQVVAKAVAAVLGGTPRRSTAGGAVWEVATDSASVPLAVDRSGATLGFRLEGCSGLGRFDFCPAPWTVAEITRTTNDGAAGVGGWDTGPRLIIKRVEVRTHTGVHAVHLVPVLMLPHRIGAG